MISQQALDVYCNEVVRDAMEENEKLRQENETLEPIRDLLSRIQLRNNGESLQDIYIREYDQDQDDSFVYSMSNIDLSFEQFQDGPSHCLSISVSGVDVQCCYTAQDASFRVLDDSVTPSVEIVFAWADMIRISAVLTHSEWTATDDLQAMIEHRHAHQFQGSQMSIRTVSIDKEAFLGLRRCDEIPIDQVHLERVRELQTLATANTSNGSLSVVANEYIRLAQCNATLKGYRDLAQVVSINTGDAPITFNLADGCVEQEGNQSFLVMVPTAETRENSIPLSLVYGNISARLSGLPWCPIVPPTIRPFEEPGSNEDELPISITYWAHSRVAFLRVNLDIIQSRLDYLGINTTALHVEQEVLRAFTKCITRLRMA